MFFPKIALATGKDDTDNLCDECAHSISWHINIVPPASPTPSGLTSAKMDAILSTYLKGAQSSGTGSGRTVVTQNKGKRKKSVADTDDNKFTSVRIIAILPHGLDDDGSLKHAAELTPQQIDELLNLRFTTIGSRSQHKFGNNWDTDQIDEWLHETLPVPFERLDLIANLPDHKYQCGTLSSTVRCPRVTCIPITNIVEAMEDIAMQAKKGKGKAVRKRKAVDSDDDIDYNTQSEKRKITGKKSLANSGDDYVIAGPSGQSMKRKA
ncbi:hypothetical protein JB92DRAFT_2825259 [Gautieria morchelliformis]|nr:hypothetical protein JB92DRAFT_2825259 [Gautieria morchelliformis]